MVSITKMNQTSNIIDTVSVDERRNMILEILNTVYDPEIPVLSITDLGIVRDVLISPPANAVEIIITPTYSGCPAMDVIAVNIRIVLLENGFKNIKIVQQLSPAWTTDWITKKGKDKLKSYGIAAPVGKSNDAPFSADIEIECPQCNSTNTKLLSQFGSTACKALYQCNECKEPFDYFKCH